MREAECRVLCRAVSKLAESFHANHTLHISWGPPMSAGVGTLVREEDGIHTGNKLLVQLAQ